eukprot:scaffold2986_cov249-Pinguiococcus_pyrenoidosus.AAC.13
MIGWSNHSVTVVRVRADGTSKYLYRLWASKFCSGDAVEISAVHLAFDVGEGVNLLFLGLQDGRVLLVHCTAETYFLVAEQRTFNSAVSGVSSGVDQTGRPIAAMVSRCGGVGGGGGSSSDAVLYVKTGEGDWTPSTWFKMTGNICDHEIVSGDHAGVVAILDNGTMEYWDLTPAAPQKSGGLPMLKSPRHLVALKGGLRPTWESFCRRLSVLPPPPELRDGLVKRNASLHALPLAVLAEQCVLVYRLDFRLGFQLLFCAPFLTPICGVGFGFVAPSWKSKRYHLLVCGDSAVVSVAAWQAAEIFDFTGNKQDKPAENQSMATKTCIGRPIAFGSTSSDLFHRTQLKDVRDARWTRNRAFEGVHYSHLRSAEELRDPQSLEMPDSVPRSERQMKSAVPVAKTATPVVADLSGVGAAAHRPDLDLLRGMEEAVYHPVSKVPIRLAPNAQVARPGRDHISVVVDAPTLLKKASFASDMVSSLSSNLGALAAASIPPPLRRFSPWGEAPPVVVRACAFDNGRARVMPHHRDPTVPTGYRASQVSGAGGERPVRLDSDAKGESRQRRRQRRKEHLRWMRQQTRRARRLGRVLAGVDGDSNYLLSFSAADVTLWDADAVPETLSSDGDDDRDDDDDDESMNSEDRELWEMFEQMACGKAFMTLEDFLASALVSPNIACGVLTQRQVEAIYVGAIGSRGGVCHDLRTFRRLVEEVKLALAAAHRPPQISSVALQGLSQNHAEILVRSDRRCTLHALAIPREDLGELEILPARAVRAACRHKSLS